MGQKPVTMTKMRGRKDKCLFVLGVGKSLATLKSWLRPLHTPEQVRKLEQGWPRLELSQVCSTPEPAVELARARALGVATAGL